MGTNNIFISVSRDQYNGPNGLTLSKEVYTQSLSKTNTRLWVVRNPDGEYLDHDKNKHELANRHSCVIQ